MSDGMPGTLRDDPIQRRLSVPKICLGHSLVHDRTPLSGVPSDVNNAMS